MVEFYGAVMLGPQEEPEREYMIVLNEQGEEEVIPPERFWEYSGDAMRYIAPKGESGESNG